MDLLLLPGRVTFENGGGDGDVTSQLEAIPIALERERHEIRVSEKTSGIAYKHLTFRRRSRWQLIFSGVGF